MKLPVKIRLLAIVFTLVSTFYFLSSAAPASAASQTPPAQSTQYIPPNTNPDVPNNLHNWTQSAMIEVMSALSCQLSGIDPTNPNQACLGVDQKTGKIGFVENGGGAIGVMDKLITMTFTMPIHTGDYVAYLSQNFGVSKQAYAQGEGVGFEKLSPFLPIWVAFRDLVYLLFILVFVVIGMFIMLRVQFDPRTVMTVQNQIPKLIIGIILVTFSFAIAGLMIDAMYIVIYFAYGVALTVPGASLGNLTPSTMQGTDVIGAFGFGNIVGVANTIAVGFASSVQSMLGITTNSQLPIALGVEATVGAAVLLGFMGPLALLAGLAPYALTQALPWLIIIIIIFIAIFTALFKLWFELIKAYTFILFDIVLAPFWIISSLTPGNPAGFSLWVRAVLSNLSVFPTTIIMFILGNLFINAFAKSSPSVFFVPPLIGSAANPNLISGIVGITVILTTPAVVGMVKNAFKAPNFPLTTAGKMFATGTGVSSGTLRESAGAAFVSRFGTMPEQGEKPGIISVARRFFR